MTHQRYVLIKSGMVLESHGRFNSPAEAMEYAYFCLPSGFASQVFVGEFARPSDLLEAA